MHYHAIRNWFYLLYLLGRRSTKDYKSIRYWYYQRKIKHMLLKSWINWRISIRIHWSKSMCLRIGLFSSKKRIRRKMHRKIRLSNDWVTQELFAWEWQMSKWEIVWKIWILYVSILWEESRECWLDKQYAPSLGMSWS